MIKVEEKEAIFNLLDISKLCELIITIRLMMGITEEIKFFGGYQVNFVNLG